MLRFIRGYGRRESEDHSIGVCLDDGGSGEDLGQAIPLGGRLVLTGNEHDHELVWGWEKGLFPGAVVPVPGLGLAR